MIYSGLQVKFQGTKFSPIALKSFKLLLHFPWKMINVALMNFTICRSASKYVCFICLFHLSGPGRSWIAGPAGISRLGPYSEPRGNNRSFPETRERDRVPVKKIGSRDSIFGLVNSTYSFEITNHNQLFSNIKYLANFIKKYLTYFRYQNWQIFRCASRPASACRSGGRHLGKFAWGSNLALVFEAVQSRPSTTFPESWHDFWKQYYRSFARGICLPVSPNWRYRQNYDVNKWQVGIREAFLGRISASPEATDGWHCWHNIPNL